LAEDVREPDRENTGQRKKKERLGNNDNALDGVSDGLGRGFGVIDVKLIGRNFQVAGVWNAVDIEEDVRE
jgi:hypothetical protein